MTAEELIEAREALGLKQVEFARIFHVSDRTLRAWGSGAPSPWRPVRPPPC
jgi:DNA-binding transcriptional regulator YiaG